MLGKAISWGSFLRDAGAVEASEFEDAGVLDGWSVGFIQTESSPLSLRSTTGLVTKNSASGSRGKWWCSSSNAFGQWRRLTPSCPKCPRARGRPRRLWNPRAHHWSDGKPASRDRNQQQDPYRWKCSQWVWARPEPRGSSGVVLPRPLLGNYHSAGRSVPPNFEQEVVTAAVCVLPCAQLDFTRVFGSLRLGLRGLVGKRKGPSAPYQDR